MNQDMVDMAYTLARAQKAKGQKCIVVLFPSRHSFCTDIEGGVYTRYSDEHHRLKSPTVDTLITVGDAEEFTTPGLEYIFDRMRASVNTKVILLTDDWPCFSKTGASDESI